MSEPDFDRVNMLTFFASSLAIVAVLVFGIGWAGARVTESVTERHAAAYEACEDAMPEMVLACVELVDR